MRLMFRRYQTNTTQTVLDTIISVQPKEAGAIDEEPREVVVTRQAKEMLEKVPPLYDMFEVKERFVWDDFEDRRQFYSF